MAVPNPRRGYHVPPIPVHDGRGTKSSSHGLAISEPRNHSRHSTSPGTPTVAYRSLLSTLTSALSGGDGPTDVSGTSVRPPDKFSGRERSRFRTFIAQNRLVFRANPQRFASDTNKVTYACSYLEGIAFSWYENFVTKAQEPDWFHDFTKFEHALEAQFGQINSSAIAERKVQRTTMKSGDKITEYLTKFNTLRIDLDWNDAALSFAYKRGLPSRIKDEISRNDKAPNNLQELVDLSLRIDFQYWDREGERQTERIHDSISRHSSPSASRHSTPSIQVPGAPTRTALAHPSSSMRSGSVPASSTSALVLSQKLELDITGKINKEERQRRLDLNICLYCAGDHFLEKCTRRPPHTPRSTQVSLALPTQSSLYASRHSRKDVTKGNDWGHRKITTVCRMALPPTYSEDSPALQEFQTRDMLTVKVYFPGVPSPLDALIDSGSYHSHLDGDLAYQLGLSLTPLANPISVVQFDGSATVLSLYSHPWNFDINQHRFEPDGGQWLISKMGGAFKVVLGFDFLKTFNPFINWETGEVKFRSAGEFETQCPSWAPQVSPCGLLTPPALIETLQANENGSSKPLNILVSSTPPLSPAMSAYGLLEDTIDELPGPTSPLLEPSSPDTAPTVQLLQVGDPGNFIPWIISRFQSLFVRIPAPPYPGILPPPQSRVTDYQFRVKRNAPPRTQSGADHYWLQSTDEVNHMKKYFDKLEARGLITPSIHWGASSRALALTKRNGIISVYIDYTQLNKQLERSFDLPITNLGKLLLDASVGKFFSRINIRDAFHQLRIRPEDEHHTRFSTPYGASYCWKVMPYGLLNNVDHWHRFIKSVLPPSEFPFAVNYSDDIVVFSRTREEHLQHVRETLLALERHDIKISRTHSEWDKESTTLYGIRIGPTK